MFRILTLAFFLCTAISACTSVPLSTMAKLSTFDWQDFNALQAGDIQVKITVPQGFELNIERSWLGFELSSEHNHHSGRFDLQRLSTQASVIDGGLFGSDIAATTYRLQLQPESRPAFTELQAYLRQHKADNVMIRVVPKIKRYPANAEFVSVWIDLQLSSQEGFFTLVDGSQLSLSTLKVQRANATDRANEKTTQDLPSN
ncbi:hypothetical protein CHH28_02595 [Bacterioplanes sanyensis]|uniref:DUF3261 domain-containing protein n=1 Tax=Bacterioplanes sanyensis TaxID=1249553 RepID=A0A222FEW6_9GAMM|nr:hypothetical protein [Bacterioplanes sanyensis]ASP37625.1 hypothetical protein CHH28_02595 [Bacterioplanes sanyensis]